MDMATPSAKPLKRHETQGPLTGREAGGGGCGGAVPPYMTNPEAGSTLISQLLNIVLSAALLFTGTAAEAASVVKSPYVYTLYWAPYPLRNGGWAQCVAPQGCHGFGFNPVGGFGGIVAKYNETRIYRWNGVSNDNRQIGAFWPAGKYMQDCHCGVEGYIDEWRGVILRVK